MAVPLCKYFNECGGCNLQHIDYSLQLENKAKVVQRSIKFSDVKIFSDKEYEYRNRMDFIFHKKGVGFRRRNDWKEIIPIEQCVIAEKRINEILIEVNSFFLDVDNFDLKKQTGTFKYAVIRTPSDDSSISFVLNEESSKLNEAIEKIKNFAEKTTAKNIIVTYTPVESNESISGEFFVVKGKDMLTENLMGNKFTYSIQGFFQNNTIMAEKMHEYVNSLLKNYETNNSYLLDLYGGVGTFGINNSNLFKGTDIVESFAGCKDAADINIKENNSKNTKWYSLDAMQLKKLIFPKPLFVINDPPRSGMHQKTIDEINRIMPEVIIYISCNVEQLAKELPKFRCYEIKTAAIFDLFPQTNHMEAVVELIKKKL